MSEALIALLRANLAAAIAVALVLILRRPARAMFGASVAYGLWTLVPLAALAMLAPARMVTVAQPAAAQAIEMIQAAPTRYAAGPQSLDLWPLAGAVWAAGVAISLVHLVWRQRQFGRAAREGRAGPAVIGVLRPSIVKPSDFEGRYTEREQLVVLAHERTHIARHDPRINAAVALARCVNWFNPLIHAAAHYLRIDQELACDAQVVAAHPGARRAYAEAMLKTQLAARPLPLGCYWPAEGAHPLAERIGLLARKTPSSRRRKVGARCIALLALAGAGAAWAGRPAEVVVVIAPEGPTRPGVPISSPVTPRAAAEQPTPSQARHRAHPAKAALVYAEAAPEPLPAPGPDDRLLSPGEFGPPMAARRVHTAAGWSRVEPGSAVRVRATMTDRDGIPLTTDLTAFGSQSYYRLGYILRNASRYKLFTSVVQNGDRLLVTASLSGRFDPASSGSVTLASGQTGQIRLSGGEVVLVTPTIRPETPEEVEAGRGRRFVRVDRIWTP
ncbi:M56 family metallopeptidase [Phenylobacterium sp.]|uniref:M56 family metallopeptidase n=1 Tax=Phenylobacterium sp. TaxID=1871053 RepID=UPI002DE6B264|nr:M56 family metallopeptidase [Phenylobacterium sp.]